MSKHSEDKKKAVSVITKCAIKYKENLLDTSLLFVCTDKHKKIVIREIVFEAGNFLHLTGCKTAKREIINPDGTVEIQKLSAPDFFKHCVNGRLSEDDFEFADNGTTPLKLEVLPILMEKDISANQIGEYNNNGLVLECDSLAGNVKACMGMKEIKNGRYIPNSALNADIREYIKHSFRIIVTYQKKISEARYNNIVHVAKKVEWDKIKYPKGYEYLPKPTI